MGKCKRDGDRKDKEKGFRAVSWKGVIWMWLGVRGGGFCWESGVGVWMGGWSVCSPPRSIFACWSGSVLGGDYLYTPFSHLIMYLYCSIDNIKYVGLRLAPKIYSSLRLMSPNFSKGCVFFILEFGC